MKNISLVLNGVLLIAVAVLFYLHFSGGRSQSSSSSDGATASSIPTDIKIAYINSDSVLQHYDYLKVNRDQLEAKSKKLETEYGNRVRGLQNEIAAYQRNVGSMTLSQVKAVEEDLGKKQQNLQMYQQTLQQQMMEEETKLNRELYGRVTDFLKKYGADNGLSLVLKFDPTSDVLYGTGALDITQEVIKGLNDNYQAEKIGGGVKADTTTKK